MTHIALLRGINVGGRNPVKMAALVQVFESLGFADVRTYVQSGNVVFGVGGRAAGALTEKIARAIEKAVGFPVPVIVRTGEELREIARGNPLVGVKGVDEEKLHVTFLSADPGLVDSGLFDRYRGPGEEIRIKWLEVYLYCPGGYGKSKLVNGLFERILGVGATTRNWRTVKALLQMSALG